MPLRTATCLVLAVALAGCGGGDDAPSGGAPRAAAPEPAPDGGAAVAVPDGGVARGHGAGDATRVRVPERDTTPPLAQLRLDPGGGEPVVVHRSPVRRRPAPAVALARPEVRATALIRDLDGGTGRIRLSVHWVEDCGDGPQNRTVNLPPSQIERIRVAPGVLVPAERRRSARVRLPRDCRVTGKAFADATNASGAESFSDPVRFTVTSPKASGDEGARSPGRRNPYLGSLGERIR